MIIVNIPETISVSLEYEEALRDGYLVHSGTNRVSMVLPWSENPFEWAREHWDFIIARSKRIGAVLEEQGIEVFY